MALGQTSSINDGLLTSKLTATLRAPVVPFRLRTLRARNVGTRSPSAADLVRFSVRKISARNLFAERITLAANFFFHSQIFFSAEVCQFSTHLGAHSRGVEGPRGIRVPRGISSPAHPSPTFAPLALQLYIRYLTGQFLRGLNVCRAEKSFANFSTQQNFLC